MRLRTSFIAALSLAFVAAFTATDPAHAARGRKNRPVVTFDGKITSIKRGKDRKKRQYWEYRLKTRDGQTLIVHDYQYGKFRKPATMGIAEGAKKKVRGFFVNISTEMDNPNKEPVLIVSPAN